jgi:hypothetical protein
MNPTFNWYIQSMFVTDDDPATPEFVVTAIWQVVATTEDDATAHSGASEFLQTGQSSFTPYNELTNEEVVGWVQAQLGPEKIAEIEAKLTQQLKWNKQPPTAPAAKPLPWSN